MLRRISPAVYAFHLLLVVYILANISCFVVDVRVFSDRLVDRTDVEAFIALLEEKLASFFDLKFHSICPNKQPPIFGTCLTEHTHTYRQCKT